MGNQLFPEPSQLLKEVLGQKRRAGLGLGRPHTGLRVQAVGKLGLTCPKASLQQLAKPRVWNTPSRRATVEADTSGLLSVRATLGPCTLYFPWGEARPKLGLWGSAGSQEWVGPGGTSHYLSSQAVLSICHLRSHPQCPRHQESHGCQVGAS